MRNAILSVLICGFCAFALFAEDDSLVLVLAKGRGETAELALKDSFRDAVERAVGVFVDAESQAENDALICDKILTQSNAYIENYRTVSERKAENGIFEVKIVAKVKKAQLTRKLRDTMPPKAFSLGDDLKREYESRRQARAEMERQKAVELEEKRQKAVQQVSQEKRDADAAALIRNTLKEFNPSVMTFDVTATGAKPIVTEKDGDTAVLYGLCLRLSTEKYFKTLVPRLKQLFGQIALEPPLTVRFIMKRPDPRQFVMSMVSFNKISDKLPEHATNIIGTDISADCAWRSDVEINGTACRLPDCKLAKDGAPLETSGPAVWLVEKITGSGSQIRVTMVGYKLSETCCATLQEIVGTWKSLPPAKYVAELVDASGEMVTAQKFQVEQDSGWIGIGEGLKDGQAAAFFIRPWLTIGEPLQGRTYADPNGNRFVCDQNGNWRRVSVSRALYFVESVPFMCRFKILEDELKSVSSIRVRLTE